jgi:hypothetical protein
MADPNIPAPPLPPVPARRNAASAIWSLVLGILSIVCVGVLVAISAVMFQWAALGFLSLISAWIFTAIPAVICGHVARSVIRKSRGELAGEGRALTGLILGYLAILMNLIVIPTIAVPALQKQFGEIFGVTEFKNEIVSADGKERILAPANWKSLPELNEAASIGAGAESQQEYLIVLSQNKADLADFTLEKHHQSTRDQMIGKLKDGSATSWKPLTIDGHPALQDEISGVSDNTNIVFLHTTIDHGKYVHQILAWTPKSGRGLLQGWEFQKPRLEKVTLSFRSTH